MRLTALTAQAAVVRNNAGLAGYAIAAGAKSLLFMRMPYLTACYDRMVMRKVGLRSA